LHWPQGYLRAKYRKDSPYKVSTEAALNDLLSELRLMGAKHVIVSSNVPLRRDGTMYRGDHSDSAMPDPGVAVYWYTRDGRPLVAPFDGWRTVRENVRAVGLTIAAFRAIERAGAIQLLERAYTGFARLPAAPDCWGILGVERGAPRERISARFRELGIEHHPDRGGNADTFKRITEAYHQALGSS
jgi:hypothetical protein